MTALRIFLAAETGATAIEYVLMASLIALAIIAPATGIGSRLGVELSAVSAGLK